MLVATLLLATGASWLWVGRDQSSARAALASGARRVNAEDQLGNTHGVGESGGKITDVKIDVPSDAGVAATPNPADGVAEEEVAAPAKPAESAVGFVVYKPFLSASECQADLRFNPRGVTLAADELEVMQRLLDESNRTLAARQVALQQRTEAWGKLLIENGLSDTEQPGGEMRAVPQTTRVGVLSNGRLSTVTVRAGDNAELDQMNADLLTFVRTAHEQIHEFFK